ncbi:MAG TPA: glutathione S-transferase family protein [Caulobacter sp.]|nr:glutathione S-transferase family protein [Caulobacter sp.]
MLTFFYAPGSCSDASRIALEEAGADYRALRVDLRASEQLKPEYLALNPKGRVPALVTDAGVITENVAILGWIAQSYPEARLAPTDPFGFARAQAFNAYLSSTVHVAHAHKMRGYRWADDPACLAHLTAKVPETMAACFRTIEEHMIEGPWVLGEAYSVCDAYLFTLADWLEGDGVDPRQFPKVYDHRERVRARPATRKVLAQQAA